MLKRTVIALVTVAIPTLGGLAASVWLFDEPQASDMERLFAAKWFPVVVYYWILGAAGVLLLSAVVLLRRMNWGQRRAGVALGLLFGLVGGGVVAARSTIADEVLQGSRDALYSTPIQLGQIEGLCTRNNYWTGSSLPTRAVIAGPECDTIVLFRGWFEQWRFKAPAAPIGEFTSFGNTYIVTAGDDEQLLVAVGATSGKKVWQARCSSGWELDRSQENDWGNEPANQKLGVACDGPNRWIDPAVGPNP